MVFSVRRASRTTARRARHDLSPQIHTTSTKNLALNNSRNPLEILQAALKLKFIVKQYQQGIKGGGSQRSSAFLPGATLPPRIHPCCRPQLSPDITMHNQPRRRLYMHLGADRRRLISVAFLILKSMADKDHLVGCQFYIPIGYMESAIFFAWQKR